MKAAVYGAGRKSALLADLINNNPEQDITAVAHYLVIRDPENEGVVLSLQTLYEEIGKILGLDKTYRLIMIGAGRLARAIGSYVGFQKRGFQVEAFFDRDPEKHLNRPDNDIMIYPLEEMETYLKNHQIDIAVIAIPADAARKIIPILDKGGVKGIWNFARTDLDVPDYMTVQSVHLSESLMQLSYKINH